MNAIRDEQVRYLVHFNEGGSGMRWYDEPLKEGGQIKDGGYEYVVVRVIQPSRTDRSRPRLGRAGLTRKVNGLR